MPDIPEKKHGDKYTIDELYKIVELLRSPEGCPWDRAQTHYTLIKPMIEEAYEVVDAVEKDDPKKMTEELGDVLLQVIFHTIIGEETGDFTFDDVTNRCAEKMLSRHTHIFGDKHANDADEALANWEQAKKKEKGFKTLAEELDDIPKSFPALMRAQKAVKKIEKAGKDDSCAEFDLEGIDFGDEKTVGKLLYEICRRAYGEGVETELALKREIDVKIGENKDEDR